VTDKHVRGTPALVIEILSLGTRRRDRGPKLHAYERHGVREYWLVDPDDRGVEVRRPTSPGALAPVAELSAAAGDVLRSPLLPGFSLAMTDLFP
jgi:Uma2 family endonuclease